MSIDTADPSTAEAGFHFDNSYARTLDGFFVPWQAAQVPAPVLVKFNRALATELGLDADVLDGPAGVAIFSGNRVPAGATPIAQAYAGHQFGGFSPQLGDGRALLLGEVIDTHGQRRDIAFKGSGRTPFSRGGDGKAALGPVLREYLMGEAMHALGIPTTRALAAVATGESVLREAGALPGAVLTRVAASHLRVGTFQFFATRGTPEQLKALADYAIGRHDPTLADQPQPYLALLRAVTERQAALLARWMGVGFIHGVMNTDNMTISGETIDYGPCAFMDAYDPATVFSSIDRQGRYAYGNQPGIAQWNLARLAETLLPLLHEDADTAVALATEVVNGFPERYQHHWQAELRRKLGLDGEQTEDEALMNGWLDLLQAQRVDFTQAFRQLTEVARTGDAKPLRGLFTDAAAFDAWLARWQARCAAGQIDAAARAEQMRLANPAYIPRNHLVEAALSAAVEQGDLAPFERLLSALQQPFHARQGLTAYEEPAPAEAMAGYRTFCGT
ncbi:protein adenylyltransferase SelO family protein [Hydrogenophaga sp.]|uniref:protein adenylyltransferase SelO n=1 Tax=Hydrogenophaga sp. TaxID=1904254 RepID=UPI0025C70AA2|nr:YdiU family protein [Hydrogenophaga sp.]